MKQSLLMEKAEAIARDFEFCAQDVCNATYHVGKLMADALARGDTNQIPSYVNAIPDGTETGVYLAIDLGGTNCRVCSVDLHGDSTYTLRQTKHVVPASVRVNPSYKPLFLFVAERLKEFLAVHHADDLSTQQPVGQQPARLRRQLGFTFSFTCNQTSLAAGTLAHWDKGWDVPEALGRDPCAMLQWAIDELDLPVAVSALANDSVGSLLARSYTSGPTASTLASAIFGTGTNAAYVERLVNVTKLPKQATSGRSTESEVTAINTEWGCFDEELQVLPSTEFDDILNRESTQPNEQMMEKRVGGLYLGELFRLVAVHLIESGLLDMTVPKDSPVFVGDSLDASLLSSLAEDTSEALDAAMDALAVTLNAENVSRTDTRALRMVSMAVVRRAARISGAYMAAIILRSGRLQQDTTTNTKPAGYAANNQMLEPQSTQASHQSQPKGFRNTISSFIRKVLQLFRLPCLAGSDDTAPPSDKAPSSSSFSDAETLLSPSAAAIDIGVDGSIIEYYPRFEEDMRSAMRDVPEIGREGEAKVTIGLAKDGSSVGAALMALAAAKQTKKVEGGKQTK